MYNRTKKFILCLLIGCILLQVIGCQKSNTATNNEKKNASVKEKNNEVNDTTNKQTINDSEPSSEGTIVQMPEGAELPEGAESLDNQPDSGLPKGAVFIPKGVEIPEGAQVLFTISENGTMGEEISVVPNQYSSDTKDALKDIMPRLCTTVRKSLIENGNKIHPEFDMKNVQILLVSNMLRTSYLINSQDPKYGSPDEVIEYSTDTFKDKSLLVQMFSIVQFNNQPTYIFNVDFFTYNPVDLEKTLLKTIVHESIHLLLQKKLEKNIVTLEETMGSRSISYPIDGEGRRLRAQMANAYKKALEATDKATRETNIKKGNYFLQQYLNMDEQNKSALSFDRIEGQARYYEYRALAILEDLVNEKAVKKRTQELYMASPEYNDPLNQLTKNTEFYLIGSLAYALIYDLDQQDALGNKSPVTYLLDKYGEENNQGDEKLSLDIKKRYDTINAEVKASVDDVTQKLTNDDYIKIKIPVYYKYEQNGNVAYSMESIEYAHNNQNMTIEKVSREIQLGNNRILLKDATVLTMEPDVHGGLQEEPVTYHYAFVPTKDVTFDGEMLSAQSNHVQIYDAKFQKKDGIYQLVE